MGIPPEEEFGNNCIACFPTGQTPKYRYASFSDIQKGDLWASPMLSPPNTTFKLQQGMSCIWSGFLDGWTVNLAYAFGESLLTVDDSGGRYGFESSIVVPCAIGFSNSAISPVGEHYYGGTARITEVASKMLNSLTEVAELINFDYSGEARAEFYPVTDTEWTTRFAEIRESTNIYIQLED